MPDLPTRLDLYALGRNYVVTRATRIDPKKVDVLGSDINIFVGSQSIVASSLIDQLAQAINRLLLDGCQDDDLDRYALDRYDLPRKGASAAVGSVRFFRQSNALGGGSIPVGTKLNTSGNVEYITTTVATFGALDTQATADVRAVQAGKATEVGANTIRKIQQPQLLWDQSIQVTNDLTTAGGEDREDDDTFKARIRNFWNTARRGILAAIEFGALTVPGVVSAKAIEALTTGSQPARVVNLYIADSSGVASTALGNQVQTALLDFRAGGISVVIFNSIPSIVSITLVCQFQTGVNQTTLSTNIKAAIVEFVNSLPVNGPLYIADIFSVLRRFVPDGLIQNQNSIISPTGDVIPTIGQNIRTTLQSVLVNGQ